MENVIFDAKEKSKYGKYSKQIINTKQKPIKQNCMHVP